MFVVVLRNWQHKISGYLTFIGHKLLYQPDGYYAQAFKINSEFR